MKIQEVKLDLMQRGFAIVENIINQEGDGFIVQVIISKRDTDNLIFTGQPGFHFDAFLSEEFFVETIKGIARTIDTAIINRHSRNPNNCNHFPTKIMGGKLGCQNCMITLGEHKDVDKSFNITLNNN